VLLIIVVTVGDTEIVTASHPNSTDAQQELANKILRYLLKNPLTQKSDFRDGKKFFFLLSNIEDLDYVSLVNQFIQSKRWDTKLLVYDCNDKIPFVATGTC
jgi:hypothetical protein